jgi:capsular exopolysaccharide synthesis family protein
VPVNGVELEKHRIVARQPRSASADIFRILRTKVLRQMTENNLKAIAVTSPNYGDGKTTVAVNLALSLALDVNQTVLLVDLDLRSPDIHRVLGVEPSLGLCDHLVRGVPLPECLVKPDVERLVVLPFGRPMENSSEMLASPRMAALAREMRSRYSDRLIIYDMPPVLTQDDTIAFLPNVDGVLLVVCDGVTPVEDVAHCMTVLAGTNVLGTVLNNCMTRS